MGDSKYMIIDNGRKGGCCSVLKVDKGKEEASREGLIVTSTNAV